MAEYWLSLQTAMEGPGRCAYNYGSEGWGFESLRAHHVFAGQAQVRGYADGVRRQRDPAAAFGHFRARITLVSPGQSQKTPSGDRARSSPRTSVANASARSPNRCGDDQEKEK